MENENLNNSLYVDRPGVVPGAPRPVPNIIPPNTFAKASMILGIVALALMFTFTIYPTIILGALSIILALLSKGHEKTMHKAARTGVIIGTIALCADILMICSSIYLVFTVPQMRQEFNDIYEEMYGDTFDNTIKGLKDGTLDYDDIY